MNKIQHVEENYVIPHTYIYITYKLPFLSAINRITTGPDNKINAVESNCPITCKLNIIISF